MIQYVQGFFNAVKHKPILEIEDNASLLVDCPFGSQKGQVKYLLMNVFDYENKGLKRDGWFVDLACADGVTINNTYFLEKQLGWRGLLFEPNPKYAESIRENRISPHVTACVTDGSSEEVVFRIDNLMLGGIVGDDFDNNTNVRGDELHHAEVISVPTTTLIEQLELYNAPEYIDYFSLDVEGAEELILKGFDFSRYKFRCITIERPTKVLDLLLDANGYVQVKHQMYDVFYLHRDFLGELNRSPTFDFKFTEAKDW